MKRREFLKYGTVGATLPFWLQGCDFSRVGYPVKVNSDHRVGHLMFDSKEWPMVKGDKLDVAIVGGGIAGLTAAYKLRSTNFRLFELSQKLGGTVGDEVYEGIHFSQGAHYELAYPENYGEGVLKLLEELKLITYQPWSKSWDFTDRQHIIPYYRRQQCYDKGERRRDVIPDGTLKRQFVALMLQYVDEMKLPTRLIDTKYHHLNAITFYEFLSANLAITESFVRQVDYHMYDDYGGGTKTVSALAGIHYFACRPYYTADVSLFSPPNGNAYFADAMIQKLGKERLKTSHLVKKIEKSGNGFELQVINLAEKKVEQVRAERVIYAGQKHALKYVYPDQAPLFENSYAPWMIVNLIADQKQGDYGYWQNEFLGENKQFLGFIDSSVQVQDLLRGKRVFTAYYCLNPTDREYLTTIEDVKEKIAQETQNYVELMLKTKLEVKAAFIKVMGHAMPIPKPGYLFRDVNDDNRAAISYAGVDNGRLPLLFEALDSGLMASNLV